MGIVFYLPFMISIVICVSFERIAFSLSDVTREFVTLPLIVLFPTIKQPAESDSSFPLWIRIPIKCGTLCRSGNFRLNRGLYSMVTLYVPAGIAVSA